MTDKVRLSPRRLICCQAGSGAKPENATRGIFLIACHKQQVEASSAPALLWYLPAPEPCRSGALQPVLVPVWFSPADPVPAGRSPSSGRWVGAGGSSLGAHCTCVAFTMQRCCRFPPLMRPNSLAQQVGGGGSRSRSIRFSSPGAAPSPLQQRQLAPAAGTHASCCSRIITFLFALWHPWQNPGSRFETRRCRRAGWSSGSAGIWAAAGGKGEREEEFRLQRAVPQSDSC